MKKFVAYDKMSKKDQKNINSLKRNRWEDFGCLNPKSKVIPDKKKDTNRKICRAKVNY